MKILFLLPSLGISGGIYIVIKGAEALAGTGRYEVTIALPERPPAERFGWLCIPPTIPVLSYAEAARSTYDVVLSTWWETLFDAAEFEAQTYALFMQAMENSFYNWGHPHQALYESLMNSHAFPSITTARWMLNYASRPACYFLCGLDKSLFHSQTPLVAREGRPIQFLIEGPLSDPRKNVVYALDFLEQSGLPYLWVGSDASPSYAGRHCLGVFTSVPLKEMAAVYSSADVLIKLSNSEGMFGPPLEMFACGGTALCWDIWGAEEYMIHGYNSLLCPTNNFSWLAHYLNRLRNDSALLGNLKTQARRTAEAWPSWPEVAPNLIRCIQEVSRIRNRKVFSRLIHSLKRAG